MRRKRDKAEWYQANDNPSARHDLRKPRTSPARPGSNPWLVEQGGPTSPDHPSVGCDRVSGISSAQGGLAEQRAACYAALGDKSKEPSDRAAAANWLSRSAQGLNNRTWRLVTGPPGEHDVKRGLELIEMAVEIEPDEPMYRNTFGVALYRNGRRTEAMAALEQSLAQG